MKLVHALWGSDQAALRTEDLRGRLRNAGVTRMQVNLDDEHVAAAQLRLTGFDRPPDAVVSTWGGEAAAAIGVLSRHADRHAAWRVEERRPLEPPLVADGERAEALANVAFLRRPEELDHDSWRDRWLDHHTTVAIETQATFGYVQDVVVEQVAGEPLRVDGIVEELFPPAAATDFHSFYGTGGDEAELERRMTAMLASVASFGADRGITVVPTSRYVFDLEV